LGIKQKKRKYFWKLLLETIKYNYNFLDHAIFYATLMYQYEILLEIFLEKDRNGMFIYSNKLSA
jgi:hypothetical protein